MRAVIDASVAVKLFVPEELSTQARAIFARFASEDGAKLVVPDFFFIECANVFWKWVQRFAYPGRETQAHLRDLASLGLEVIPVEILAEDALLVALAQKITVYDGCYVALAAKLQLSLLTADAKLVAKLEKAHYEVRWLGDIPLAK
ncbi:MAG: type II toxin-antitoxin system VapC family toxin [Acidobacteria bacterium]|nr:type II toxin-antitoxin system VapC family toxin [Acidobacteriota bacterium]